MASKRSYRLADSMQTSSIDACDVSVSVSANGGNLNRSASVFADDHLQK
jgi:hypothetical protein